MPDGSFHTVVTSWTLCTVTRPEQALSEIRRVLKPKGRLVFVEHGRAAQPRVAAWQDRFNPWWRSAAGGCNMNRPIHDLIGGAGFRIAELATKYSDGPKVLAYLYRGIAEAI